MLKNNYNTNKDGDDIESNVSYDCDLSRMYFEESIEVIQHSNYSRSCISFYTDCGQIDKEGLTDYTVKGLKADLIRYLNTEVSDIWTIKDYIDAMQTEIIDNIDDSYNLYDYNLELEKYDIVISHTRDIRCISVTGYSQGDYAKVLCDFTALKKLWGNDPKEEDIQKHLNRLFYDAPVYACIEINGTEYNYYDYIEDPYEWDRDTFLNGVSKDSGISTEILGDFIPEYPEYR